MPLRNTGTEKIVNDVTRIAVFTFLLERDRHLLGELGRDAEAADRREAEIEANGMSQPEKIRDVHRSVEPELMANVFRWTGHFPERTRVLLRFLAERAGHLEQGYARTRETTAIVALTTLVTSLAMNYVQRGSYLP